MKDANFLVARAITELGGRVLSRESLNPERAGKYEIPYFKASRLPVKKGAGPVLNTGPALSTIRRISVNLDCAPVLAQEKGRTLAWILRDGCSIVDIPHGVSCRNATSQHDEQQDHASGQCQMAQAGDTGNHCAGLLAQDG